MYKLPDLNKVRANACREIVKNTSRYALLYVYRPGKPTNSWGFYPVYFDDRLLCMARNRSGIGINVEFGKTYYVKSLIHWTISSRLYNFKLEMALMDQVIGET